jgi:hypothetical protein
MLPHPLERAVLPARSLFHDVCAGQFVAASLEHLNHGRGHVVASQRRRVDRIDLRQLFGEQLLEREDAGIIRPLRFLLGAARSQKNPPRLVRRGGHWSFVRT